MFVGKAIGVSPRANIMELFIAVIPYRKKLECLSFFQTFHLSLIFVGKGVGISQRANIIKLFTFIIHSVS